jgi:hypothetical protein
MLLTKLHILLIGVLMAAASLLTHLYEEHMRVEMIRQNAFHHTEWKADNVPADRY